MWWHLGKLPQVGNEARVAGLCQVHEGSFVSSGASISLCGLAESGLHRAGLAGGLSVLGTRSKHARNTPKPLLHILRPH